MRCEKTRLAPRVILSGDVTRITEGSTATCGQNETVSRLQRCQ
jgi:hypothetical protein